MIAIRKAALAGVFALAGIGAAHAGPVETFAWNAYFTDTGPAYNNGVNFTGTFAPQPYSVTGGVGYQQTIEDYLTVKTTAAPLADGTDTLKVSFDFYKPDDQTSTVTGLGSEIDFFGIESGGTITWQNNGTADTTFDDGSEIKITLDNATFGNIGTGNDTASIDATLLIEKVPEPGTIFLLGVGLFGLGYTVTRRALQGRAAA